jgi:hypothetical protein
MSSCFVMQPFDGDVFDKRYEDVFAPAIKDAGLEPYRVDRDPGVSVPIDDIESGIKNALLCFAEITSNNPNVWFELGFAIAASKEVVLVCAEERKDHFPFDVQHRSIIKYKTGAPQDYRELQLKITERITALLKKREQIGRASSISPIKDTEGLSQHEIVALVTIMQNRFISSNPVSPWTVKSDMNAAGFTDIAITLAVKLLCQKGLVADMEWRDEDGSPYTAYATTEAGEKWLLDNQGLLELKCKRDDLPF